MSGTPTIEELTLQNHTYLLRSLTAVDPLQIEPSQISGVGLFSVGHIKPGQEILRKVPLVSCVDPAQTHLVCDYCHLHQKGNINYRNERFLEVKETGVSLQACGGCQRLKYCSKQCQTKAWQEYHKLECDPKRMKQVQKSSPTTQILIRLLYKIKLGLVSPSQLVAIGQLESKKTSWMQEQEGPIKHDVLFTRLQTKSPLQEVELQNILCRIMTNSAMIRDTTGSSVIHCFDPALSLLNHSCEPNAYLFVEGKEVRIRSSKALSAGVEITFCYGGPTEPVLLPDILRYSYMMEKCCCPVCQDTSTSDAHDDADSKRLKGAEQELFNLFGKTFADLKIGAEEVENKARRTVTKYGLDPNDPDKFYTYAVLMTAIGIAYLVDNPSRGIKVYLKGLLSMGSRREPTWIRSFADLLRYYHPFFTTDNKKFNPDHEDDFPTLEERLLVYYWYVEELQQAIHRVFGPDAVYSRVIRKWCLNVFDLTPMAYQSRNPKSVGTKFRLAQFRLLDWVGIDRKKAVALTFTQENNPKLAAEIRKAEQEDDAEKCAVSLTDLQLK